jgi:hypothetical protein
MMRAGRWALLLLAVALPCRAAPERALVGLWVTDLYDLDATNRSFTARFWIWSVTPVGSKIKPIESLSLLHSRQVAISDVDTVQVAGKEWAEELIVTVVRHQWDTRSFPFDRHTLEIVIEDSDYDDSTLQYVADQQQSGVASDSLPPSWRVTGFRLMTRNNTYPTTFGDPLLTTPRSQWSRVVVQIDVQRDAVGIFVKLLLGAYVAFLLSMLSFRIKTDQPTLFSARLALLVGSLFATVVNLRSAESVIGRSDHFTLVDKIHLAIALYILAAAVAALASRREHDRERPERAIARDRLLIVAFGASFVVVNAALIWLAMR